jgi:hypothetical protein
LNNKTDSDLVASPDCLLASANVKDFLQGVGATSFNIMEDHSNLISSLSNVPLFKNFTQNKLEKIARTIQVRTYKKW